MVERFDLRCKALLECLHLSAPEEVSEVRRLTGGVASDIACVVAGKRTYCVKFALEKLKVAEDWRVSVLRNRTEYAWLEHVSSVVPQCVPKLYGRSEKHGGFAMEFVAGQDVLLWKNELFGGTIVPLRATAVGALLGRIHASSTVSEFDDLFFRNRDDFHALRIEPYLLFTAKHHPELSAQLHAMADKLYSADIALIHGDVSPKNILFRGTTPVLLDAECATMGDPCFDLAFCLNHLILKAVHLRQHREELMENAYQFWAAYSEHVTWETPKAMDARVAALLPVLMLARIDGKSPVEYLTEAERENVRQLAKSMILQSQMQLSDLLSVMHKEMVL